MRVDTRFMSRNRLGVEIRFQSTTDRLDRVSSLISCPMSKNMNMLYTVTSKFQMVFSTRRSPVPRLNDHQFTACSTRSCRLVYC